ncbi:tripartite tricarboxylate transporter TctB family protein [Sporosarcina contaminans]|uniref:Tripartite tricarboxylate transporter TctB family protein n=1 Tax=Sporosarcina contaminans TaxID=633403 RepID=A0ABW3TYI7_9BACL
MKKVNTIIGLIAIVFSIITFIIAFSFPDKAKFWPQLFSVIMILLSLGLIFGGNKKEEADAYVPNKAEYLSLLVLVVISVAALLFINVLGFSLIAVGMIAAILWYTEYRKVKNVIAISIGTSLALTLIFQVLLRVPLPQGIFETLF